MSEVFLKIINMSISASYIVLAVLLLRLLLRKAPKWITVLLWGIVAVRLVCPFSVESVLSLIPSAEVISPNIMTDKTPTINTGIQIINSALNPVISDSFTPNPGDSANPLQIWIPVLTTVWIVGMAALLIYTVMSYARVRCKIGTAVLYKDNVYQSENVVSPFVLGIIKPKIYLPFNMNEKDMEHVVAHEMAHIRRKDHLWKPLGFILLTLHWFNPLMWLGYILLCRDIELACDEKVIKELDHDARADYSEALLTCSVNRRMIAACPLAFGEVGAKQRIKSVLNYKKPAFWIVVLAVIACIAVAVCFLTNPPQNISIESISRVTYNDMDVSEEYVQNLVSMIQESRCSYFPVGADDPNDLSVSVQIHCDDGSMYLLHYQYYSGFSFSPSHPGEDDYRSILTYFSPDGKGSKAWKLEYDFDAKFKKWLVAVRADPGIPYIPETDMQSGKQLTLDDVITLSAKGYDLTWEDFYEFKSFETGSGLYIRVYDIDETFSVWIGGSSPVTIPMYIYLSANGLDNRIDIRDGGVEEFIGQYHSSTLSDTAMLYERPVSYYVNLAFDVAKSLADSDGITISKDKYNLRHDYNGNNIWIQFYGLTEEGWDDKFVDVALVQKEENGVYHVYEVDTGIIKSNSEQIKATSMVVIGNRFESIVENMQANPSLANKESLSEISAYDQIFVYGEELVLEYIFSEFLTGKHDDLHGDVMMWVMLNLLNDNEIISYDAENGQDYFDHWLKSARSVGQQHDSAWLEDNVPAIALVLSMLEE